jgi:hypothetical protein
MDDQNKRLNAIRERAEGDRAEFIEGGYLAESDLCIKDREFLLDLVRKQQDELDSIGELP